MDSILNGPVECDLVIFGVTGDLARRKLAPALYQLENAGFLKDGVRIIGVARTDLDRDGFQNLVLNSLVHFQKEAVEQKTLEKLFRRLSYCRIEFAKPEDFLSLPDLLNEAGRRTIFYLATPAAIYANICAGLAHAGLINETGRIVLEKPIGDSYRSSKQVNDAVAAYFNESQIYRIDHYLGKETVLNLLVLRFANSLFTSNWDHSCIDHVQISVAESVGLEDRWEFYDQAGQMRDMVQNHLLQILCLLAMEPPLDLEPESIRSEKLKVLKALRPITADNVARKVVRGQYTAGHIKGEAVPAYLQEPGSKPDSHTETFVALKAEIDNWRWAGVPFYLRTGKRLATKSSEISVHFKAQPHNIFRSSYAELPANKLTLRLEPDEGIELQMVNKVPGITEFSRIQKNTLDLSFSEAYRDIRIVDAYERLLLAVMSGNQSLFVRRDEVEQAWLWVDRIIEAWQEQGDIPDSYPAGSWGPNSSISLIARDHRQWEE